MAALICCVGATARADLLGHHPGADRFRLSQDKTIVASATQREMWFWDVRKRTLVSKLSPPTSAVLDTNGDMALSADGRRILVRQKTTTRRKPPLGFRWMLMRQVGSRWQAGSVVARATLYSDWPLDAQFVGQDLFLLWSDRVDHFGPNGKLRASVKLVVSDEERRDFTQKPGWPVGSITPDGQSVLLSRGKMAVFFSTADGRQQQRLDMAEDYGIVGWSFSPDGRLVNGWNRYQRDGDWNSPEESDDWIWNAQTGQLQCHIPYLNTYARYFWEPKSNLLLEGGLYSAPESTGPQTFKAREACNHDHILTFPRSWPAARSISQYRFSSDGELLVVLDEKDDIWVETL